MAKEVSLDSCPPYQAPLDQSEHRVGTAPFRESIYVCSAWKKFQFLIKFWRILTVPIMELPNILSSKCKKWNIDVFTVDVYLKCFQRYFLPKMEKTCQTVCCNMLLRISYVCERDPKNQTALLQFPVYWFYVCFLKSFCAPFNHLYKGGNDNNSCLIMVFAKNKWGHVWKLLRSVTYL